MYVACILNRRKEKYVSAAKMQEYMIRTVVAGSHLGGAEFDSSDSNTYC